MPTLAHEFDLILDVWVVLAPDLSLALVAAAEGTIAATDAAVAEDGSPRPMRTTALLSGFKQEQR